MFFFFFLRNRKERFSLIYHALSCQRLVRRYSAALSSPALVFSVPLLRCRSSLHRRPCSLLKHVSMKIALLLHSRNDSRKRLPFGGTAKALRSIRKDVLREDCSRRRCHDATSTLKKRKKKSAVNTLPLQETESQLCTREIDAAVEDLRENRECATMIK